MSEGPINSLDRFRKRSGRLVLDEMSAGCGGLVFRWRNPHTAVPLYVGAYAPVPLKLFLDGVEVTTNNLDLSPGPHQIALALEEADRDGGLFLFAALHQSNEYHPSVLPAGLREPAWQVVSSADGTWLASLDEPPGWMDLGFDDSSWQVLTHSRPNPAPDWSQPLAHLARWCVNQNAVFLALSPQSSRPSAKAGRGRVQVRKRLEVPGPQHV